MLNMFSLLSVITMNMSRIPIIRVMNGLKIDLFLSQHSLDMDGISLRRVLKFHEFISIMNSDNHLIKVFGIGVFWFVLGNMPIPNCVV